MPQEEICRNRIISENYRDFIVKDKAAAYFFKAVDQNKEQSKKEDKQNHGIGLKSVNKIVESYGGFIEIRAEDSVFQVNILM